MNHAAPARARDPRLDSPAARYALPYLPALLQITVLAAACAGTPKEVAVPSPTVETTPATPPGSFADDCAFLSKYTRLIVLKDAAGRAQIAIAPDYQARVMTSTAGGPHGTSYGYVHRAGVAAGKRQPHITVLGGEDRFWLGPEGGQYGLYFAPGSNFDLDHWQVPEPLDWGGWPVTGQNEREVSFTQEMALTNYAGTRFTVRVQRTIRLLDAATLARALGAPPTPGLRVVGYESDNTLENRASTPWNKQTGLMSIWILGMFKPAPRATVVLPYVPGPANELGPIVNDAYFGPIAPQRLAVGDRAIFLRADGRQRGKIGVPRLRVREWAGSYDPESGALTLVQFSVPEAAVDYVSSLWEHQSNPYAGDVVNSYNDGPLAPGGPPLGPFYEIESSSPAVALAPGQSVRHLHRTLHLEGADEELDAVARRTLGVSLAEISRALP